MKLSYSTHGLPGTIFEIIDAMDKAGYAGVELAFQENQFDLRAYELNEIANCPIILKLKEFFKNKNIKPAAINTATLPLLPGRLHEPSLLALDVKERQRRIHIIKQGIEAAKALGAPIVGFGSGFIRSEHVDKPNIDCHAILLDAIKECLQNIKEEDGVTLVIEPEPGMLVETLDQGALIVAQINSKKFALHLDVCHAFCSDGVETYIQKIRDHAHLVKYLHLADTKDGYNLKIIEDDFSSQLDFNFANYLIYFPQNSNFLLLDAEETLYFYTAPLSDNEKIGLEEYILKLQSERVCNKAEGEEVNSRLGLGPTNDRAKSIKYYDLKSLPSRTTYQDYYPDYIEKEKEIRTYLLSVPRIHDEVLILVEPILHYLRSQLSTESGPFIKKRIANTLTGKVHFHEEPGLGQIDFPEVFKVLHEKGFNGYASLELYHDGEPDRWQTVMKNSKKTLDLALLGWGTQEQGDIDHEYIQAPSIRLNSCKIGEHGDKVYAFDLRIFSPNKEFMHPKLMHSFEHCLLAGFRKYLGDKFICVAPMGCQTGFYLVLLNEGRASTICDIFALILNDILAAEDVPYANINQCGQAVYHDINLVKSQAKSLLFMKDIWRKVL